MPPKTKKTRKIRMQSEMSSVVIDHPYGWLIQDSLGRFPGSSLVGESEIPYVVALGKKGCGKSSLVGALSGIPFPTGIGRTVMPTEILLLRSGASSSIKSMMFLTSKVKSDPHPHLPADITAISDIPKVMEHTESQLRGLNAWVMGEHILRIDITGPDLPNIAFVDLPAKTNDPSKDAIVNTLIHRYVSYEGTVILNVLSASDICNEAGALNLAEISELPPDRTINVIIEPEKLPSGMQFPALMSLFTMRRTNNGSLSWHVIPSPITSSSNTSPSITIPPWSYLHEDDIGMSSLRVKILDIAEVQYRASFPRIAKQIEIKGEHFNQLFSEIDEVEPQQHLTNISHTLEKLVKASIDGEYEDIFFHIGDIDLRRLKHNVDIVTHYLRACLQTRAQGRKLLEYNTPSSINDFLTISQEATELMQQTEFLLQQPPSQRPSDFSSIQLVEKFIFLQSTDWPPIARECVFRAVTAVVSLTRDITNHITVPTLAKEIYKNVVWPVLQSMNATMVDKLQELCASRCQPQSITPTAELLHELENLQKCMNEPYSPNLRDAVYSSLLRCSRLYYQICLQTFIEKIEREAIGQCLLEGLPQILHTALGNAGMNLDSVKQILQESEDLILRYIGQADLKIAFLQVRSDGIKTRPPYIEVSAAERAKSWRRLKDPPLYIPNGYFSSLPKKTME